MMARIRTVKPELFRHEELFELEKETGLPIRLCFIALFTCCDREGRFRWKPRQLQLDCIPYDDIDFSRVLDALATRGFVIRYTKSGVDYGCIPTFSKHQVINNREKPSDIPCYLDEESEVYELNEDFTRAPRVSDACPTPLVQDQVEGEGKGKGREGKGKGLFAQSTREKKQLPETSETWSAYADAYANRYGIQPLRNQQTNSQMAKFCKAVPLAEAPAIAAFYVWHNDMFYVKQSHPVGLLLNSAQKLRTEWATGRQVTTTSARQLDQKQSNYDVVQEAIRLDRLEGKIK